MRFDNQIEESSVSGLQDLKTKITIEENDYSFKLSPSEELLIEKQQREIRNRAKHPYFRAVMLDEYVEGNVIRIAKGFSLLLYKPEKSKPGRSTYQHRIHKHRPDSS